MQTTRERWHGTSGGYTNHKCRCDDCRDAFRIVQAQYKAKRRDMEPPASVHGTKKGYAGWSCRCQACREAYGRSENIRRGSDREYRSLEQMRADRDLREAIRKANKKPPGYMGAHQNVRRKRGPAKTHSCEFCGERASDWALIATAANILTGETPRGKRETWSADVNDYRPLCRSCHREYDWHVREYGACVEGGCKDPQHARPIEPVRRQLSAAIRNRTGAIRGAICRNGHDLTIPGAIRLRPRDGRRECVDCNRDRCRRWRDSKKS